VNFGTQRADRASVRQPSDTYFVRINPQAPPEGQGAPGRASRKARERVDSRTPGAKRRRRRQFSGKRVFLVFLLVALCAWAYWASQRPGGVSGTIDGWIKHVRGDVAQVSADPDAAKARRYYQSQYQTTGVYPNMSDTDLSSVGIGVGVTVDYCSPKAVVIQGATGGGFSTRLLVSGKDFGEVPGRVDCPNNLADPAPWHVPTK
jgi:hypothetical protein